jgi:hypothetical protein
MAKVRTISLASMGLIFAALSIWASASITCAQSESARPRPLDLSALGRVRATLEYPITRRSERSEWTPPGGWSLFATGWGHSVDLSGSNSWGTDPLARPGELEVGAGWREQGLSATIGFVRPNFGAHPYYPHSVAPDGLVGLSISFGTR